MNALMFKEVEQTLKQMMHNHCETNTQKRLLTSVVPKLPTNFAQEQQQIFGMVKWIDEKYAKLSRMR